MSPKTARDGRAECAFKAIRTPPRGRPANVEGGSGAGGGGAEAFG